MSAPDSPTPPGDSGKGPVVINFEDINALAAAVAEAMKQGDSEVLSGVSGGFEMPSDPKPSTLARFSPRMLVCLLVAVVLSAVVALIAPQQVPVMASKLALVSVAGYLGYWMDRWLFPYSRPDGYLCRNWKQDGGAKEDAPDHAVVSGYEMVFAITQIRRAAIIVGVMIAIGLGL